MNRQATSLAVPIDHEFQAAYAEANGMPRESEPRTDTPNPPSKKEAIVEEDERFAAIEALAKIAKDNQARSINRKQFQDGSFDQIENDVSNICRVGWNFLTR